jgi:hypothetical protein
MVFREELYGQILQEITIARHGCLRILGMRPSAWVTLGAAIAICLIVYGMIAVPDPSASVVINSDPLAPHSLFTIPGV